MMEHMNDREDMQNSEDAQHENAGQIAESADDVSASVRRTTAENDVVISSRVRLARNYQDIPFPTMMNDVWAAESVRRTTDAVASVEDASSYRLVRMADIAPVERQSLVEKHLISRDLSQRADIAAALIRQDEQVSIMVNEEDHLRIQALMPGDKLETAARLARQVDEHIERNVQYAFDEQLGYLTTCPTNTGSGMRASVMLHLPALTMAGQMGAVNQGVAKLGLTIRGLYGEGSEALGNLYQVSNQITLGRTEQEIVETIEAVGRQLTDLERRQRKVIRGRDAIGLEDQLMRSVGLFTHARRMDGKEFMQRWSDVRLAVALGMVKLDAPRLDKLLYEAQPACIIKRAGREMTAQQRDEARAALIRTACTSA